MTGPGTNAAPAPRSGQRVRIVRWTGVIPLAVALGLIAVVSLLLLDPVTKWSVEEAGTQLVGARVDLVEADVRLQDGVVVLRGLQVTDPARPMTNMVEADEIVVNLRVAPLLEKKVILDTVAIRGVRFGTPRATSGALAERGRTTGQAYREVASWRERVRIPSFSMDGLRQVVNVDAIRPESLETLQRARRLPARADSLRAGWTERIQELNPAPVLDSARAQVTRLEGANLRTLGLAGVRDAVQSTRTTIRQLTSLDDRLASLQASVGTGLQDLQGELAAVGEARQADYAYARGLLNVPSLDAPELAPALFGGMALERLAPVLYWVKLAERYMPPGIERRLRGGPDRIRASGTDVVFPKWDALPGFLLEFAEASLEIGGTGAAAGAYSALLTGITSAPAIYGQPATFRVERAEAAVGPQTVRAGGVLNHVGRPIRDSVSALVSGLALPSVPLAPLGARLDLGQGTTTLELTRTGDSLNAQLRWRADAVSWARLGRDSAAPAVEDLVWRVISRLTAVEIGARLTGRLDAPRLSVQSNVAGAVAAALRDELGQELQRLEQQVRARVDALVDARVAEARQAVAGVEEQVAGRLAARRQELEDVKARLEARLRELTRIPGIG